MPKIYDCFTFFNELDLLEIRLNELNPVVDHFVLVEATRTFQKKPKPLYFQENIKRYEAFKDKIIHIVVDEYPTFFRKFRVPKTWDYENSQREFMLKGIAGAKPEDRIIVGDVDEIPLASFVRQASSETKPCVFEQHLCYYYLNNVCTYISQESALLNHDGFGFWRGSVMLSKKDIKTIKASRLLRDKVNGEVRVMSRSGWHFSFLGGTDLIINKLEAFSHKEFNNEKFKNREFIEESIRSGKSIFDTETQFKLFDIQKSGLEFPEHLKNNTDKFHQLVLEP